MADHFLAALGCARRALARPADPAADAHLLDRFIRDRDEGAFAELVARHGPVVWAACRRGADTAADAEDTFQATFLVLARRAGRVRRSAAIGGWLFRVAVRLAARTRARARARAGRLTGPARPAADPRLDPADRAAWQDLVAVLDAELAALPDAVRAALVCCYYEGLTQDEAARRLGWKVRTVRARVGRGRTILRARLARRGVDLGAALAAAAVGTATAAGPPAVGPVLPADGSLVGPPAVAALVRDGLALTGRGVVFRVAVGAVVVAAGVGCALVAGPARSPAGGVSGPPLAASHSAASPAGVPPTGPRPAGDPVAVYNQAVDGCVYIVRETDGRTIEGSGVLIDKETRLVLTTCRVVGDSDVVSVQFPYHKLDGTLETDRKEYAPSAATRISPMGRVIHRDKTRDLALVQLDRLGGHARPLELGETGIRGTVLHIGSGTGELFPMIVRKVLPGGTPAPGTGPTEPVQARRIVLSGTTDDAGGPLVDPEGKLVGIVAGAAAGPADRNVTLAIDIAEVRAFLADKDKEVPAPPAAPVTADPGLPADVTAGDLGRPIPAIPTDFDAADRDLYEKCVKSTAFIVAPDKGGYRVGSGSLIDVEKRYLLTTYDVVGDNAVVFAQFPGRDPGGKLITDKKKYLERIPEGEALRGRVLHRDRTRDLALVQLDRLPPVTPAVPLAKRSVQLAERVINIGNPGRVSTTFTGGQGRVRAVAPALFRVGGSTPDSALEIRAQAVTVTNPIQPGDSGGPVIDRRGYQVAVTVSGPTDRWPQNVTRCIDVTEVWAFLTERKVVIKDLTDAKDGPGKDPKAGNTPPPKGGATGTPPTADRPPWGGAPTADEERAAARLLHLAGAFREAADQQPFYWRKLKQVIDKYPGTAAAKEAQKLLDGLK